MHYPSKSPEKIGHFVGIAEHCGDMLTYLILTKDTLRVISRLVVRSALNPNDINEQANSGNVDTDGGELVDKDPPLITSTGDYHCPGVDQSKSSYQSSHQMSLLG